MITGILMPIFTFKNKSKKASSFQSTFFLNFSNIKNSFANQHFLGRLKSLRPKKRIGCLCKAGRCFIYRLTAKIAPVCLPALIAW
jgi:hypothetical protein